MRSISARFPSIYLLVGLLALPLPAEGSERRLPGQPGSGPLPIDNPCNAPDLTDSDAVYDCAVYWHPALNTGVRRWSAEDHLKSSVRPTFRPQETCAKMQKYLLLRTSIGSGLHPDQGTRAWKLLQRRPGAVRLASCDVLADVVEDVHTERPVWEECTGYNEAPDKAEHMRTCLISFTARNKLRGNEGKAKQRLRQMGCTDLLAAYEHALSRVHHTVFFRGVSRGYKLPTTYSQLDCLVVTGIKF